MFDLCRSMYVAAAWIMHQLAVGEQTVVVEGARLVLAQCAMQAGHLRSPVQPSSPT